MSRNGEVSGLSRVNTGVGGVEGGEGSERELSVSGSVCGSWSSDASLSTSQSAPKSLSSLLSTTVRSTPFRGPAPSATTKALGWEGGSLPPLPSPLSHSLRSGSLPVASLPEWSIGTGRGGSEVTSPAPAWSVVAVQLVHTSCQGFSLRKCLK